MKKKYFGTDGIRGRSNTNTITPEMMIKFAMAVSIANNLQGEASTVVIGKDTRLSGYMLEYALTSGFISMGVNIVLVGPMPTPAISMLTRSLRADMGIMISASHNPYYDNGIKLFGNQGYKLSAEEELKIEELLDTDMSEYLAPYDKLGKAIMLKDAKGRYIEKTKSYFPQHLKLDGVKIVIDCANGAAYNIAPKILSELGANVISHAISPNGFNINEKCGVLSPDELAELVLENKADIGIALDGDADRILIVDEKGNKIDGDQIIALIANNYYNNSKCTKKKVVTTILSNMGLENYLNDKGIELIRTAVGDKHVVQKMQDYAIAIGGEPSGHIIIGDDSTTGDGIKVALEVLKIYVKANSNNTTHKPISELLDVFTPLPQSCYNISYDYKSFGQNFVGREDIQEVISKYQDISGKNARIILRQSGTEPVIRLMIESKNESFAKSISLDMSKEIESLLV